MVMTQCGPGSISLRMDRSFDKLVMTQQDCEGIEFVQEKAKVTLGQKSTPGRFHLPWSSLLIAWGAWSAVTTWNAWGAKKT